MKIVFLGTNGWYDTETGYTPCALIDSKDYYVILDAGNGLYKAGKYIKEPKPVYLFISHFHLDHIEGLHVLQSLPIKKGLRIFVQEGGMKYINRFLDSPFTTPLKNLPYRADAYDIWEGVSHNPFPIIAKKLQHGVTCFGYRLELDGKVITYCTDTQVCDSDLDLAQGADLLIHECSNLPGMLSNNGHSNPADAAKLAKNAKVKQLVLTHFAANLYTSITKRKEAEKEARKISKNTTAAMDDMEISI